MSLQDSASNKTNGFAIAAMVNGIVAIVLGWTIILSICGILAVVFGHVSLSQLKQEPINGRGMAIAGLVLGYVSIGFWTFIFILAAILA
jgi:hypothetical protein